MQHTTRRHGLALAQVLLLVVAAGFCSGCMAARTGVAGSSLTRNAVPRVTMAANAPLVLRGYGTQPIAYATESLTAEASGTMDYALYAEGATGPVARSAHVLIAQISNERRWIFRPDGYSLSGGLSTEKVVLGGAAWTVQTVRVLGEGDWFSALWRANGRETPPVWIARRFSATPDNATRLVAEYREPWPDCLDADAADLVFARDECLGGFMARSGKAFSLELNVIATGDSPSLPPLKTPGFAPDMTRIAGEVMENTTFDRWR